MYRTLLFPWASCISFAPPENETIALLNLQTWAAKRLQHVTRGRFRLGTTITFFFPWASHPAPWNQLTKVKGFVLNGFLLDRAELNNVVLHMSLAFIWKIQIYHWQMLAASKPSAEGKDKLPEGVIMCLRHTSPSIFSLQLTSVHPECVRFSPRPPRSVNAKCKVSDLLLDQAFLG